MFRCLRGPLLMGLLFATAFTLAARDEWYDFYLQAIDEIEAGRPADGVGLLRQALSEKPRGGYLRTYGNNFLVYAPQYRLASAHAALGDCSLALEHLDRSERANETRKSDTLTAERGALRTRCEQTLARAAAAKAASRQPTVDTAATQPAATRRPAATLPRPSPPKLTLSRDRLQSALNAHLAGDFDRSVSGFEALARHSPKSATIRALLASALYTAASARDDSPALMSRCRTELARAKKLDASLALDPRYFPPGLLTIYDQLP